MKFRAELMAHTEGIEMILATVHMCVYFGILDYSFLIDIGLRRKLTPKKSNERHKTLAGKIQDSYFGCMQRMTLILETISTLDELSFSKIMLILC